MEGTVEEGRSDKERRGVSQGVRVCGTVAAHCWLRAGTGMAGN